MELDKIDQIATKAFEGFIVPGICWNNSAKLIQCPPMSLSFVGKVLCHHQRAEIQEGLEIVKQQLQDRTVRPGEEEYFKSKARERVPSSSLILLQLVWMRHQIAT